MQNHEQKKMWKTVENQDSMGKTNFFLSTLPFNLLTVLATCRSSLENTGKINLIPILNKTSPRAHTKLDLDVLGIHGKLVEYEIHLFKRKN
jgi:hypothetical protein